MNDRIVSLHQPWVRPIVRGKAAVPVEFGAKVALSMSEGYARVEEISWDAFNEGKTLIESMERYKERTGHYPERGLVDRIYRTRENLAWCKERGIRLNGPKLGRPPRDRQAYLEALELERLESGERNEIEGCIGVCKRRYGLDLVMMRLKHSSEVDIHVSILTRNLFKRLKSLLPCFGLGQEGRIGTENGGRCAAWLLGSVKGRLFSGHYVGLTLTLSSALEKLKGLHTIKNYAQISRDQRVLQLFHPDCSALPILSYIVTVFLRPHSG